ncbi:MAG: DUF2156 domain-containing protein [Oligoflexia bacterium]|nr:DUF2156 domain-containing protein [Oligoflexia bacterium]
MDELKLNINDFKKFDIEDRKELLPILAELNPKLSDYSFANLFIWSEQFGLKWLFHEGKFLIYDSFRDYSVIADNFSDVRIYLNISDQMIRIGKSGGFYLVDSNIVDRSREEFARHFEISIDESFSDYIYDAQKLVELKGGKLSKKKNLISQFQRNYPNYFVKTIEKDDVAECIALANLWCKTTAKCDDQSYKDEEFALKKALLYFKELDMGGLLLKSTQKQIQAFSIFSKLNDNTADIHFEKSDISIHGAAQVINWETAKYLCERFKFLNREQDLGVLGLRQAKKSYAPEFIYHSYILKRIMNGN